MHIAEGILSPEVLATGWIVSSVGTFIGLKKTDYDNIMKFAVLTSAFFVVSLLHIPVGPSNVHLVLPGLIGIVLGWTAFPAILAALFLQALFFQFGGITTLGINCMNMSIPAVMAFYMCRPFIRQGGWKLKVVTFIAGGSGVFTAAMLTALSLAASGDEFIAAAKLLLAAHVPVMIIEAFITMTTTMFLVRVQPEMFDISTTKEEK
jgi:cobalt/nickel transport system permease protein